MLRLSTALLCVHLTHSTPLTWSLESSDYQTIRQWSALTVGSIVVCSSMLGQNTIYYLKAPNLCMHMCCRPRAIDDSQASRDWGWAPKYDLQKMTQDMLKAECSGKHA